jgi:hypothetical protein
MLGGLLWAKFDEVGVVERNDEESSRQTCWQMPVTEIVVAVVGQYLVRCHA